MPGMPPPPGMPSPPGSGNAISTLPAITGDDVEDRKFVIIGWITFVRDGQIVKTFAGLGEGNSGFMYGSRVVIETPKSPTYIQQVIDIYEAIRTLANQF